MHIFLRCYTPSYRYMTLLGAPSATLPSQPAAFFPWNQFQKLTNCFITCIKYIGEMVSNSKVTTIISEYIILTGLTMINRDIFLTLRNPRQKKLSVHPAVFIVLHCFLFCLVRSLSNLHYHCVTVIITLFFMRFTSCEHEINERQEEVQGWSNQFFLPHSHPIPN